MRAGDVAVKVTQGHCVTVWFVAQQQGQGDTKKTGTFEMRSGSERMHTWRRTPSTGRNFQTLIIWITVS